MAHYTQPTPRLLLVQSFTYRGEPEEWSNRYSFKDLTPTDSVTWKAIADAFIAALQPCFGTQTTFVRAYGYAANAIGAEFVHDYASPGPPLGGTYPGSVQNLVPGDAAVFARLTSDKLDRRGKRVYGRNYYHNVFGRPGPDQDQVEQNQQSALTTFLTAYTQGTIHPKVDSCLPDGTNTHSPHVDQWITTRTLHRRGKRPPPAGPI
jgi:hypothetical protein